MDYEALRFIWWGLIGVLLIGFVVTDDGRPGQIGDSYFMPAGIDAQRAGRAQSWDDLSTVLPAACYKAVDNVKERVQEQIENAVLMTHN